MGSLELLTDLLWSGGEPTAGSRYLAVPSRARPRYLLPMDIDRRAQHRLLMAYNDLRSPGRRLARRMLAQAAVRGLLPGNGRRRIDVPGVPGMPGDPTLLGTVADALGRRADDLVMAIGVNDKGGLVRPTVTVADRAGRPLLFVKVARHPELQRRLACEFEALAAMQRHPVPGIITPVPVLLRDWSGRRLLGVSPLPLQSRGVRFRERPATDRFLDRLHSSRAVGRQPLASAYWTEALRARIGLLTAAWRTPLGRLLDELVACHGTDEVRVSLRHGDWSPWNMAHVDQGRLAVWDWEFSEAAAPVSLDRLNWDYAYATSVRHVAAADAALTLTREHRHDPLGVRLFLLDMCVRRAEEAECGLQSSAEASLALQRLLRAG